MTNETLNKELSVFDPMVALIDGLSHKYEIVHDAKSKEGYALIKAGIKDVGKVVRDIEKARKDKKSFYLESGRAVDAKAKEVTVPFTGLLEPMKKAKQEEDARVAKIKQDRIDKLQLKIDEIYNAIDDAQGKASDEISSVIEKVEAINPEEGFYDLTHEAIVARSKMLSQLATMLTEKLAFEESERNRVALEEKQRIADEKKEVDDQVNGYKSIPGEYIGDTSENISLKIRYLKAIVIKEYSFDYSKDINLAKAGAIEKLEIMLKDSISMEKIAEERAESVKKERDAEIAKKAVIMANKEAQEAKEKTEREHKGALAQAEIDKQNAIDAARLKAQQEAERKENERLADELKAQKEAEKKAANTAHQKRINNEILKCLKKINIPESEGKKLITEIVKGDLNKFMSIKY